MSVSCSDLLCGEDSNIIFSGDGDYLPEYLSDHEPQPPDVEESVAGLLEDERRLAGFSSGSAYQSIDASVRTESVAWILKLHRCRGFRPLTAYLSVNYLDRFLYSNHLPLRLPSVSSKVKMSGWPLQLLSVACLSLAAKMEEPQVPPLLDLQVEGANFIFEPRIIQRMELMVLRVLEWRLGSISPFCYLHFFALKIDPTGSYTNFLTSRAKEIILSTVQETSFLEHRPSSIAAAAVLCAANDLPNFSFVTAQHAESWCDGLDKEDITTCLQLIRQITFDMRSKRQPKVLPQFRVMSRASITSSDLSSSSSLTSSFKRRKLDNSSWADQAKEGFV